MRVPIKVKYDKKTTKGSMPKEWNDVPFVDYVQYIKAVEDNDNLGIYEALTGISKEVWSKPHDARLFANIDKVLMFTSSAPSCELPTHIERGGTFWEINDDFMTLELSKYRDMIEIISSISIGKEEDEELKESENIEIIPKLIAIIACKEYKNIAEIERIAKDIELMPCDVVLTIGGFFLKKLNVLRTGTEKKQQTGLLTVTMLKRGIMRLLAILVICIHYIIYPMVTLRSLKRFFVHAWVRCTGGNNYRVVTMQPRRSIKK